MSPLQENGVIGTAVLPKGIALATEASMAITAAMKKGSPTILKDLKTGKRKEVGCY